MQINVKKLNAVSAGDIAAIVGVKDTITGDTLCDEKHVLLESINIPAPVISTSVEPKNKADYEKMGHLH